MLQSSIKRIVLSISFLLLTFVFAGAFAQQAEGQKKSIVSQEIVFRHHSWAEVAAEAKKSGKYIFVDAYTTWCGPCKLLKSTTFKDKYATAYFNKHFISYAADMEKGEGVDLALQWDVTAYPALLFFSPNGKMVLKQIGYVDGKKLIDIGKQAIAKR